MLLVVYERALARWPITVKSAFGCSMAFCGDCTAQFLEYGGKPFEYDATRGMAIISLGTLWNGPLMHYYFGWLERHFPQRSFASPGAVRILLSKTAMNQLCTNPFVYLPLFYSWTGFAYGRSREETMEKMRREYLSSLKATWLIFTPLNLVNFYVTPVRHQVSVNVIASFVYNTALSFIAAPRQSDLELNLLSRTASGKSNAKHLSAKQSNDQCR